MRSIGLLIVLVLSLSVARGQEVTAEQFERSTYSEALRDFKGIAFTCTQSPEDDPSLRTICDRFLTELRLLCASHDVRVTEVGVRGLFLAQVSQGLLPLTLSLTAAKDPETNWIAIHAQLSASQHHLVLVGDDGREVIAASIGPADLNVRKQSMGQFRRSLVSDVWEESLIGFGPLPGMIESMGTPLEQKIKSFLTLWLKYNKAPRD
jgi:hypothetical protein